MNYGKRRVKSAPSIRRLTVLCTQEEMAALEAACTHTKRTKSELVRAGLRIVQREIAEGRCEEIQWAAPVEEPRPTQEEGYGYGV